MNVGDSPASLKQLSYLSDLLRRCGISLVETQKIVERCHIRRMASFEIIKALKLKKEYDAKQREKYNKIVESFRASNRRQNEEK